MDREWLAAQLEAGRSIESIAQDVGKAPSTVAYWVNKYGLVSSHAPRHRGRGGIERTLLAGLVEQGLSIRQIAAELGVSAGTVRHWLGRYALKTRPSRYSPRGADRPPALVRECALHGWTTFVQIGSARRFRCGRCNVESVSARRRVVKALLVAEAGGRCALCGFDEYVGALHFHHLDPSQKRFSVSRHGVTRSIERAREEARKCVLLCANCHAMVEAGLRDLVPPADYRG
jgi:transposase